MVEVLTEGVVDDGLWMFIAGGAGIGVQGALTFGRVEITRAKL